MTENRLATAINAGVFALQEGRFADALPGLLDSANDADLAAAPDLRDVRARVCSMLGQTFLGLGRHDEADKWLRISISILRELGDGPGLAEVRGLRGQVVSKLAEAEVLRREREQLSRLTVAEILSRDSDPRQQADLLIKKANAAIDGGDASVGASIAREALARALISDAPREEVFARLTLARADPGCAEVEFRAALRRAEDGEALTLISAVARAAEVAGVRIGERVCG